jgi:phosphate uptake regulator
MLREIINAFRRKDVVHELHAKVGEMLEDGQWMFEQATHVLLRECQWDDLSDELYRRDKRINHLEQDIRERIVTHLSVGNQADLAPCLALMSTVKDAERIGDYCKNIFEVGKFYRDTYEHHEYAAPLEEIRKKVVGLFEPTRQSLLALKKGKAESILQEGSSISKQCDVIIQQLLSMSGQFPADEAVAYVLLARHYKRVAAHLCNIATSVLSPVPLLDFRE